jgi:hypothetical protein
MHSQKNKVMNKSIMMYCPKDKTYWKTIVLISRIHLAIDVQVLKNSFPQWDSPQPRSPSQDWESKCGQIRSLEGSTPAFTRWREGGTSSKENQWSKEPTKWRKVEGTVRAFVCLKKTKMKRVRRRARREKARTEQDNNPLMREEVKECKCGSKVHQQISRSECENERGPKLCGQAEEHGAGCCPNFCEQGGT